MLEESSKKSLLRNYPLDEVNSKKVYDCAMEGDELSVEVYRYTGQILGEALANFVMFSSPEAVVQKVIVALNDLHIPFRRVSQWTGLFPTG